MPEINVFLSHSGKDKLIVRKINKKLLAQGFQTWIDEDDIPFGQSISSEIQLGLDAADVLLLFMSCDSVSSKWVENEWQAKFFEGISSGKRTIVPVLLDECAIPPFLRDKRYVDMREEKTAEQNFDKLMEQLKIT